MKNVLRSGLMLVAVAAIVVGGTGAFFSDTETSTGNVFTAGSIDLTVDHSAASYNGELCAVNCTVVGSNLIQNGSFENPTVTANGGSYQFFNSIPDWDLVAGSIIEVQRTAFTSAQGEQHVELDGDGEVSPTTIAQTFATTPGTRYRLSFQHSPRPNRPAGDNAISYTIAVTSPGSVVFTDTVQSGSGAILWQTETYEFIADANTTTVSFSYAGTANTFGGLLDNVIVVALDCEAGYDDTPGGYCELWDKKDLTTEKFFTFDDIKPQDSGTNLISLHVESNEAYMCLNVANKVEEENTHTAPEIAAGDATSGAFAGEMGQFLEVAGWYADAAGNKLAPMFAPTLASALGSITYADSDSVEPPVAPGATKFVLLEWCMGDMTTTAGSFSCDGDVPNINQTQTDAFLADLQFFAIQTRNNEEFLCGAQTPQLVTPDGDEEAE
jgi:predicted ribosomally synthesized peptide with SipW-like signal peptide